MTARFKFFAIFALAVCAWAAPEFGTLTDSRDGKTYEYDEDRARLVSFAHGYDYAFDDVGAKYVTTGIRCIKD